VLTIVPVLTITSAQSPLSDTCWRHTSTSARVTPQSTVAATGEAGVGARVGREVAVAATPDTTRLPVVGDVEGALAPGRSLPASLDARNGRADVQVSLCELG
jgi:hypothetical protein